MKHQLVDTFYPHADVIDTVAQLLWPAIRPTAWSERESEQSGNKHPRPMLPVRGVGGGGRAGGESGGENRVMWW